MGKLRSCLLVLAVIVCGSLLAQSQRELGELMRDRGEYYFTLNVNEQPEIQAISKICSIDGTDGRTVVCYANQSEYDRLLQAGYQPNLQTPPSLRANVTMWNGQGTYNWDAYLTYDQYVNMMEDFPAMASTNNRTCTLFELGTLSSGRKLLGVRINNGQPEGKPKFLYSSTMHGDEITGMILMLRLINELCTSTDTRIVNLVDDLDIYILPLTNPDGTYYGGNNTVNNARRYNGNNKDINRNYKDYFQGDHPDGNSYQNETLWTMQFADDNLFTMSANYHGGAEVMNYPWDVVYTSHADTDWYEYVCSEYVQIARQTYASYMSSTYADGVTNGATWYVISGSRQDYMNAYGQCREVTIECSTTKTPNASQLPNFWNYNHNSMLTFMEQCLKGIHGFVYDATTSEPLQGVTVTVKNHDINNSFVTTHSAGDFHRPIKGGSYTLEFTKEDYYPQSVEVTVSDGQRLELEPIYLVSSVNLPVVQTLELPTGWSWWSPNVEITLAQLETALGANGLMISDQEGHSVTYDPTYGWGGDLNSIEIGKMYEIRTTGACSFNFYGTEVNPGNHSITLSPGQNWIGYFGQQPMSLNDALVNLSATHGDVISSQDGTSSTYSATYGWGGDLQILEPGHAYTYTSNDNCDKTFTYPLAK